MQRRNGFIHVEVVIAFLMIGALAWLARPSAQGMEARVAALQAKQERARAEVNNLSEDLTGRQRADAMFGADYLTPEETVELAALRNEIAERHGAGSGPNQVAMP